MPVNLRVRRKQILLAFTVFAANFALDRLTKVLAYRFLRPRGIIRVLGDYMILVYAENSGAFLSLGNNWNAWVKYIFLLIIPIGICLFGMGYLMFKEDDARRIIYLSCIIGGGLGNLADRLLNNFMVIDFMNFGIFKLRTGILNIADLSVTAGAICLLLDEFLWKRKRIE